MRASTQRIGGCLVGLLTVVACVAADDAQTFQVRPAVPPAGSREKTSPIPY